MKAYTTSIIIRHTVPGIHQWLEAPPSVGFLQYPHRHLFTYEIELPVTHNNRDLEYFTALDIFASWLKHTYPGMAPLHYHTSSCEEIATRVWECFPRALSVTVWEDMENGARVTAKEVPND